MKKWIDLHKFFFRESTKYVLGDNPSTCEKISFCYRFPGAYVTFMWHSRGD